VSQIDIRASLAAFPAVTQPFWTWMTGKALPGQRPLFRGTPWTYLGSTLLTFAAGLALSAWAALRAPSLDMLWLLLGWPLTVNGARNMALVLVHQCGHERFTKNGRIDRLVGDFLSTLLLSQDVASYRYDHVHLHHSAKSFTSEQDPVLRFLRSAGFRDGLSPRRLWWHTLKTLCSPVFHARYLFSRLRYNMALTHGFRRLAAWSYVGAWAALCMGVPGGWKVLLLAYVVPVVIFYQQSAFLELLTEHAWGLPRGDDEAARDLLATRSWGRFCASPLPSGDGSALTRARAWGRWWALMLGYHLPVRFLVLVGDAPQHDFHHRHPGSMDWPSSAYARQADIDAGHQGWPSYWDVWGLHTAIAHVFDAMSGNLAVPTHSPRVQLEGATLPPAA